MNNTIEENQALLAAAQQQTRFDMYCGIHKAMRAMMADTLLALGRMDPQDADEVDAVCARVRQLLDFCASHLDHENAFLHKAIEARAPGASEVAAHEHENHLKHLTHLNASVAALTATPQAKPAAALHLYRELALFVADNFRHMHVEETAHNAVLWARYTDAELVAIHDELVASIPAADMMDTLRWMVPAMNPAERSALLEDMKDHAPEAAFAAALDVGRPHLTQTEWVKLTRSLGLAPVSGLVSV